MDKSETDDSAPRQDETLAKKSIGTSVDTTISTITLLHQRENDNLSSHHLLTDAEETNSRLNQIRERRRNLCEEKRITLEKRVESSKKIIKALTFQLAETSNSIKEAHQAEAAAESQLFQEKTTMQRKILQLQNKKTQLEEIVTQQTTVSTSKLNKDTINQMTEMQRKFLNACSPAQKEFYLKRNQVRKGKMKIEELESEKIYLRKEIRDLLAQVARAEKLEQKLQLADQIILKLRSVASVEHVHLQMKESAFRHELEGDDMVGEPCPEVLSRLREKEEIVSADKLHSELATTGVESELPQPEVLSSVHEASNHVNVNGHEIGSPSQELNSKLQENEAMPAMPERRPLVIEPPNSSLSSNENDQPLVELSDDESVWSPQRLQKDHRIRQGKYYFLASHPKYFKINWEKEYARLGPAFSCKWCTYISPGRVAVMDHIWVKHYGGRYKCPFCLDSPYIGPSRYSMSYHMKVYH